MNINTPKGYVSLGIGGSFKVKGLFPGRTRNVGKKNWDRRVYAYLKGDCAELEYAVPLGSEMEKLNRPRKDRKTPSKLRQNASGLVVSGDVAVGPLDPKGIPQHEPGAKMDAGKPMAGLLIDFGDALLAVAAASTIGAAKYSIGGWKEVPDGIRRYRDAHMRHRLQKGNDPESGMPHLYHAAWNILAEIQLLINNGSCPHPNTLKLPVYQSPKPRDSTTSRD